MYSKYFRFHDANLINVQKCHQALLNEKKEIVSEGICWKTVFRASNKLYWDTLIVTTLLIPLISSLILTQNKNVIAYKI